MARLLLESPRMKVVWALLPLFASSGCLFLDDLNHAPTVTITNAIQPQNKGTTLTVVADGQDAEDDSRSLTYSLDVTSLAPTTDIDPVCDYSAAKNGSTFSITFYREGTFDVKITVTDTQSATASTDVMVTITDAPPAFAADAVVKQTSTPECATLNTAGDKITVGLATMSGVGPAVSDADSMAHASGCKPTDKLTYTWSIAPNAGGNSVLTAFNGTSCAPRTAASGTSLTVDSPDTQVCLWTDPNLVGADAVYNVGLTVSDGNSDPVPSPVANISVAPNQLPCITGTEPVTGRYVVDRTQPQTFYVDGAVDDRDQFGAGITFAWSVYRALDNTWRDVPDWNLSTYTLDTSSFGVGEQLSVRVEALDSLKYRVPTTVCKLDVADCQVVSCASSPNVCNKWKTWDLELR